MLCLCICVRNSARTRVCTHSFATHVCQKWGRKRHREQVDEGGARVSCVKTSWNETTCAQMMRERWGGRIRWSGNLQFISLLSAQNFRLLKYFINVSLRNKFPLPQFCSCAGLSWWKFKSLPELHSNQSVVITQHAGEMYSPLTDADFAEASVRFIKINSRRPGALFIIYNSFDPTQKGCFCVLVFNPPTPLFHTHSNTINQTQIPLSGSPPTHTHISN